MIHVDFSAIDAVTFGVSAAALFLVRRPLRAEARPGATHLLADMREGIARGEFVPYAQPIVDLSTGRVHSLELLARWHHPQRPAAGR